jgi:hypothetical protein
MPRRSLDDRHETVVEAASCCDSQHEDDHMSNMSYCRFRNTLSDLRDCLDALDALVSCDVTEDADPSLSDDELEAAKALVALCAHITTRVAIESLEQIDFEIDADAIDSIGEQHGDAWRTVEATLDGANQECKDECRAQEISAE